MKYLTVKLKWAEPKEGSDEMKKCSKRFLVRADSITEAESRVVSWVPSNYQDAEVNGVTESDILDLITDSDSEVWWHITLSDENDKGKFVPFTVAINGTNEKEVLDKVTKKLYTTSQFEAMKRFKIIVDEDLVSEEIKKQLVESINTEPNSID